MAKALETESREALIWGLSDVAGEESFAGLVWHKIFEHAGKKYVLAIDSAAITDIYGHVCNKQEIAFELQPFEQYATLIMKMPQAKPNAVVQLLSDKEEVKEQKPLEDGQVTFKYLHPGAYRVRMFVDENRNGVWDTGKYSEKRQPEEVFYYNKKLNLRANWQITENWSDFLTTPLEEQKTKLK